MARRRRRKKARSRRASPRRAPKRRRSRKGQMKVLGVSASKALGAVAYGAARARISAAVDPFLTSRLGFLGGYADEAAMLGVNWAAGKYLGKRVPFVREMSKAGMAIELARMGENLASGFSLGGGKKETQAVGTVGMPTIG